MEFAVLPENLLHLHVPFPPNGIDKSTFQSEQTERKMFYIIYWVSFLTVTLRTYAKMHQTLD